jgi:hypothetical protein
VKAVFVDAIAVLGPGMPNWHETAELLRNPMAAAVLDAPVEAGALLTPTERRRATPTIRLALGVAKQLAAESSVDLSKAASVFASSVGDLDILDGVCSALRSPNPPVSPAQFQHIVHNAAAGYWSIAAASTALSTSLSAGDGSFAAGLLEAVTTLLDGNDPVVLVCYDHPGPEILAQHLPVAAPFAVALSLTAAPQPGCRCSLAFDVAAGDIETCCGSAALEPLRLGNAAARSLPLLERIAQGREGLVALPYIGPSRLRVAVQRIAPAAIAEADERAVGPLPPLRDPIPAPVPAPVPALTLAAPAP